MAGNTVTLAFAGDASKLEKAFGDVGSSAKKMAGDLDTAQGKAKSFGGALDAAGGAADASESKFMGTADLLDGLGGAFGLPTEGATNMMRSFGDLSGGFAALQPMIGGVATVMKTGLGGALNFIAAHPVLLTIALLTAAFVLLWKNSETFRDIVKGVFETVGNVIGGVFNWVRDNWPLLLAILVGPIGIAVHQIITHWDTIKAGFTAVKEWIEDRIGDIVGFITAIPGRIAGPASTMWDAITGAFTAVKDWIGDRIGDIVGFVTGIPGRIGAVASAIRDALEGPFKLAFNAIAGFWNNTVGRLEFRVPDWIPGIGGKGFEMPLIPEFRAAGGPVTSGMPYVVGEKGPELFVPNRSGQIVPNGAGGGTEVIQLVVDGRVLTEIVRDGLLRKQRNTPLGFAS